MYVYTQHLGAFR